MLSSKQKIVKALKLCMCVIGLGLVVGAAFSVVPQLAYAGDLFDTATSTISSAQQNLVELCMAVCPLALIVVLLLMMLTHNERKMSALIYIAGVILIASAAVLIVNSGVVVDTLKTWFEK